ncbi:MAG TPA: energy transducer TonB, partial [Desulfuromonadales bacterium]|nr:energy transducer TonB [Desulfuromonadales bacterium]
KPKPKTRPTRSTQSDTPHRRHPAAPKLKKTPPAQTTQKPLAPASLTTKSRPVVPEVNLPPSSAPVSSKTQSESASQGDTVVSKAGRSSGKNARESHAGAPLQGTRVGATPSYAVNPPPVYPALARRNDWQGEVLLRVRVTADGRAALVKVEHSSGHAVLDRSAVTAVRGWKFNPARIGSVPVPGVVRIPVRFELHGAGR